MGVFGRLFGRKDSSKQQPDKQQAISKKNDESVNINPAAEIIDVNAFSLSDFKYSQSIFDRNLLGVTAYEMQPITPAGKPPPVDLFFGELLEMTEGLLTLYVIIGHGCEPLFARGKDISVSYIRHGESYSVKSRVIKAPIAGIDDLDIKARKVRENAIAQGYTGEAPGRRQKRYLIQLLLLEEPIRYIRQHGRISIHWDVYYKIDDGTRAETDDDLSSFSLSRTIDISIGGFKGNVDRQLERDTIIRCIVDAGFDQVSKGELLGKVIRCYLVAGETEVYEMTVQFVAMDAQVRAFLSEWIESIMPAPVNSEAIVTVSEDEHTALVELLPPKNNGADITYEQICACLDNEKITHGIDYELIKKMTQQPHYNYKYSVALCTPPVNGDDAQLIYHVDMNPTFAPKENEDGLVDFKDIGQVNKISKNDLLVEKIPLTEGTPGISVLGNRLEPSPGLDKELPTGMNTVVNETNTALLAGIDGFLSIVDDTINVLDTCTVEGDVDYVSGNIDHNGIVIVKGDVRQGFSVTAMGDVIIHGTVESANVSAGGTLVVRGGCVGDENNIDAHGSVAVKFIDGGVFKTLGNLTASYILNSKVTCGASVELVNSGLIRGSHIIAKDSIIAKTIGSERGAADKTIAEVGNDPELLGKYAFIESEMSRLSNEIDTIRANIRGLMVLKYQDKLPEDKAETLNHCKVLSEQLTAQHRELMQESEILKEKIDKLGFGTIDVKEIAFEGLKVIIGSREMVLRESVRSAQFYRNNEGIMIKSLK